MLTLRLTLRLQLLSVFRLYVLARNALRKRNPGNKTSETQVFSKRQFYFCGFGSCDAEAASRSRSRVTRTAVLLSVLFCKSSDLEHGFVVRFCCFAMGSASEAMPTGVMPTGVVPTGLAPGGEACFRPQGMPVGTPTGTLVVKVRQKQHPRSPKMCTVWQSLRQRRLRSRTGYTLGLPAQVSGETRRKRSRELVPGFGRLLLLFFSRGGGRLLLLF